MQDSAVRSTQVLMTCECGTSFESTLYSTVNVTLEPDLLYRVLAGTLNVGVCPNCGRRIEANQPFFYHDMRRGLFAYVHPDADTDEEEREELLKRLRRVYTQAVEASTRLVPPRRSLPSDSQPRVRRRTPGEDLSAQLEPEAPPMQVIFGHEQLVALVESLLEPEERLGRVALNTSSTRAAERERVTAIARKMAGELHCLVDIEDTPSEYTAWIYGPRSAIAVISRAVYGE